MKETMGTAFMLRIVIVIIFLLIVFLCLIFCIGRSFRVKNGVINIIEQYQGINNTSKPLIKNYIAKMGYACKKGGASSVYDYVIDQGSNDPKVSHFYTVQVCIDWHIPVINVSGDWVIKGKTERIYEVYDLR